MGDDVRILDFTPKGALMPATILVVGLALIWLLRTPRERMILPIILVAVLIPYSQNVHLGMYFFMMRIMVLCAFGRMVAQGMFRDFHLTRLDKLYLIWAAVAVLVPLIAGRDGPGRSVALLVDNLLEYLVIRVIVTGPEVLKPIVRMLVLMAIVTAGCMVCERIMQKNPFYVFGNPLDDMVREGKFRSTASFEHPILAGSYGAVVFPLTFIFFGSKGRDRLVWIVGAMASVVIVMTSASSGPLYGLLAGMLALSLWPLRQHVRLMRRTLWGLLLFLQIVMTGPVYSLIFRIPEALHLVSGSDSYQRYQVIDLSIVHFWQWCFLGVSMDDVAHWAWGIQDITNEYLVVGLNGGLLALVLFVMILVRCFSRIGRCIHHPAQGREGMWTAWVVGCLMFVHVMSFLAVSYFSGFLFFLQLSFAIVVTCCDPERVTMEAAQAETIPADESTAGYVHSALALPRPA